VRAITLLAALALSVVVLPGTPVGERSPGSGWSRFAAPPREFEELAWTGRYLVGWGGSYIDGLRADGARYESASGRWRRVPRGPLAARERAATVWTGSSVLIWGGETADRRFADGAALDPDSLTWSRLPAAPLSARSPAASAWTGTEFIVWGDARRAGRARDGAAYDPARRRWRRLPPAPLALNEATSVWIDGELVIYGAWLDHNNHSRRASAQGIAYRPSTNHWRVLRPFFSLSPQASSVAAAGDALLVWDYLLEAALYEPRSDRWTPLPRLPLRAAECSPSSAAIGGVVLAWYCGSGALFDVDARRWTLVPPPRRGLGLDRPVAAGARVYLLGRPLGGGPPELWAYTRR
jgi:hypothetical protein